MTLCRSLHAQGLLLQATAREGLSEDPYVAARASFEPMTLRSTEKASTQPMRHHGPPCPTYVAMK